EMVDVPKYSDVAVGDRVITSGLDGVFPRGFGLGRVTVVGEPVGASKSIRLEPEVDDHSLGDVMVLPRPRGPRARARVLGVLAPAPAQYGALMPRPLAAYALRTSQRSSMVVGCVAGLLEDY